MNRKFLKKLMYPIAGREALQWFYEMLHLCALYGMGIGGGSSIHNSGELLVMKHVATNLKNIEHFTLFDCGANIGDYALGVVAHFPEQCKVYCFEPVPSTFTTLKENVASNPLIECFNFGLGSGEMTVKVYTNPDNSCISSLYQRQVAHHKFEMQNTQDVQIRTLDNFCTEQDIRRIHLLKIDVEGHELQVLQGAAGMIGRNAIEYIQFEFGGCNIDAKTYFQDFYYLLSERYEIYRILQHGLKKLDGYSEMMEIFVTTNYLAELKR